MTTSRPFDVCCDRVSKRYRVGTATSLWSGRRDFWALRNVSFDVHRGEAFGVIGRNGAGKSTMLKLLSGVTTPTEGEISISGRLAALIEVGSGFHPELTGRENAYLSGSILGLRRREVTDRLSSIADLSGIGPFLDTPVKFYSSGMYVRLGFAVAAQLEPDVLLIDEVLAVGDAEFQTRCLGRIEELKRRGTTMILVSHDLGAIEQFCERAILLDHGTVTAIGAAHDVVSAYQRLAAGADPAMLASPTRTDNRVPDSTVAITSLTLHDANGRSLLTATAGQPLVAAVALRADCAVRNLQVSLSIYDFNGGTLLAECSSRRSGRLSIERGETVVEFVMPELLLAAGVYSLGATVSFIDAPGPVAWRFGRTTLYVAGDGARHGTFLLPYECRVATAQLT
jgi:ABC-type polysaccharide/polyol phosphate transport system ATPase subunit